ncbi:U3 small nucleolar RNA-associated protein 4, partial [Tremellales sp. Uapishka_1]
MSAASTLALHRIRFYDHTPSPITALSFSPLPLPPARAPSKEAPRAGKKKEEFGVLIVARENGEVELWEYARGEEDDAMGSWVLEKTLPPTLTHPTISLMALVIRDPLNFHLKPYTVPKTSDLRLFTAGSDSDDLIERCLLSGKILQTYSIPSPPLWSLSVSPTHSLLCLTTTSPSLHFLSIPPPMSSSSSFTALEPPPSYLLRSDTLPSKTRTVSVAWGVPKLVEIDGEWEWRDSYLVTGNSDSSFRKWELPAPGSEAQGHARVLLKSRAVVEKVQKANRGGKKGGGANQKGTIVWGVGVLPDHTIVTSDSLGSVTFWDGATMSQKQSFAAHKADGMCLVVGPGGRTVFTAGPDQRVCQFTLVATSGTDQWVHSGTKRIHIHDIRALSIFPPYLPLPTSHPLCPPPLNPNHVPILASGGWDMSVALIPAAPADLLSERMKNPLGKEKGLSRMVFEEAFFRKLTYLGGGRMSSRISVARTARLVLGRKDRSVGVWRVLEDERGWEKVLEMDLRLRTTLLTSTISPDGKWLAVSDLYETKLFHLSPSASCLFWLGLRLSNDQQSSTAHALHPARIRSFLTSLLSSPLVSHLSIPTQGSGASSILFTPDSRRLILGLVSSGQTVVVQLPEDAKDDIEVLKCFEREKIVGGRIIKGKKGIAQDGDVEMSEDEEASESEAVEEKKTAVNGPWISSLATSEDGQWLALSDLAGSVSVFNLDTLQIHSTLPTLPQAPV